MTVAPGQTLLHYEILAPLGAGAMGEVWLARDSRLGREVAVKLLPPRFAEDEERLRRFEREARSVASLNHPCVAQIHDVDQVGDLCFLVLELVPGQTLGERLARGPLPVAEALAVCARVADGLEAAHEAGIIHRDLKPENVRITPDGLVKLLDFGLARPAREQEADASGTDSVLTTAAGRLLGTPTYMAPEQARGRPIDRRVDVWAFGCVLYECLTGRRAFAGESVSDVLAAVLEHEPDWAALPALPPRVEELLRRCLVKDPRQRLRDVGEARLALDDPDVLVPAAAAPRAAPASRAWPMIGLIAALVAAFALAALLRESEPPATPGARHLTVEPPDGTRVVFSGDFAGPPAVSPDGASIVFSAEREDGTRQLWLRRLDEPDARALAGTEDACFPFWSPDGREVGYFTGRMLWRYDLASGTVREVVAVRAARGGAFTGDGRILYAESFRGGLFIVDAEGGEPAELTTLDEELHTSHRWPAMVAGTDRFLFSAVTSAVGGRRHNGVYLGTLDGREAPQRLLSSDYHAQALDGWLVHAKDSSLVAVRLDLDAAETRGNPVVLAQGLAPDPSTWHGQFSASPAGVLTWRRAGQVAERMGSFGNPQSSPGDRVDAVRYDGSPVTTYAPDTPMLTMSLSPDGRMLAMDALSPDGFTDIVVCPTRLGADPDDEERTQASASPEPPRRLTFLEGAEYRPVWSPDSSEVAFRWDGDEQRPRGIYRKRLGGGSEALVRDNRGKDDHPNDWTPDGRYLVVTTGPILISDDNDLIAVPLDGGPEIPLVTEPGPQRSGRVSPDGRWLAYCDNNGSARVFIVPFAPAWPDGHAQGRWLVSEEPAFAPRWSPTGDELYTMTAAGVLTAVDVNTSAESFERSAPRTLFQSSWNLDKTYDPAPAYDGAPDSPGQFLLLSSEEPSEGPIRVLLDWQSLLEAVAGD